MNTQRFCFLKKVPLTPLFQKELVAPFFRFYEQSNSGITCDLCLERVYQTFETTAVHARTKSSLKKVSLCPHSRTPFVNRSSLFAAVSSSKVHGVCLAPINPKLPRMCAPFSRIRVSSKGRTFDLALRRRPPARVHRRLSSIGKGFEFRKGKVQSLLELKCFDFWNGRFLLQARKKKLLKRRVSLLSALFLGRAFRICPCVRL